MVKRCGTFALDHEFGMAIRTHEVITYEHGTCDDDRHVAIAIERRCPTILWIA